VRGRAHFLFLSFRCCVQAHACLGLRACASANCAVPVRALGSRRRRLLGPRPPRDGSRCTRSRWSGSWPRRRRSDRGGDEKGRMARAVQEREDGKGIVAKQSIGCQQRGGVGNGEEQVGSGKENMPPTRKLRRLQGVRTQEPTDVRVPAKACGDFPLHAGNFPERKSRLGSNQKTSRPTFCDSGVRVRAAQGPESNRSGGPAEMHASRCGLRLFS